jgi:hypothetical protein
MQTADRDARTCGSRNGATVQDNCRSQYRLYGLLPLIESESDLHFRSFPVQDPADFARLPRMRLDHDYTRNVYEGRNVHSRGRTLLAVSIVWAGLEGAAVEAAVRDPTGERGGVGLAFGYFREDRPTRRERQVTFHIVHVYVNPAYRRRSTAKHEGNLISSWIVEKLVAAVRIRARALGAAQVEVVVDPNAPCFQLGNTQYMTEQRSKALENMYVRAGFEVVPLLERNRRTVRRVEAL